MLAGEDPEEIQDWVRRAVADEHVTVEITEPPEQPNRSPPDTALYKGLADALRRRAPGAVVVPQILVGFTDNWTFRRCGLHGYGWSPFVLGEEDLGGVHGNDERVSLANLTEGVRAYTEMLLAIAGA
jgi:carboxypeptidase PM20D1